MAKKYIPLKIPPEALRKEDQIAARRRTVIATLLVFIIIWGVYLGYDLYDRNSVIVIPEEPGQFETFLDNWKSDGFVKRVDYLGNEIVVNEESWKSLREKTKSDIVIQLAHAFAVKNELESWKATVRANESGTLLAAFLDDGIQIFK